MIKKEEYEKFMQESKMRAKRRPIHLIKSLLDQMELTIEGLTTEIKWIRKTVEDMERDDPIDAPPVESEGDRLRADSQGDEDSKGGE